MPEETMSGAMAAIVTPFTPDGELDEDALRRHIDFLIQGGVTGVVPCGGTGEFNVLSSAERRRVIEVTTEHVAGRVDVVAQTGALSTREALEHTVHAKKVGATGAMVGVPFYEPLSREDALRYFQTVGAATDLPIMLYNYPYATGFTFDVETVDELISAVPTIRYLKDSGGDLAAQLQLSGAMGDRLRIFSGFDWQAGPALVMGAVGVVNAATNVFPDKFVRMCTAAEENDSASLFAEWERLMPYFAFLASVPFVSAIKHSCRFVGSPVGSVREPAQQLSPDEVSTLERILAEVS